MQVSQGRWHRLAVLAAAVFILGGIAAGLAAWWRHYPLLRAVGALQAQLADQPPARLGTLRVYRATGGGCGELVLPGERTRRFVVDERGRLRLEPLEDGAAASLADWRGFWREARRLCPQQA